MTEAQTWTGIIGLLTLLTTGQGLVLLAIRTEVAAVHRRLDHLGRKVQGGCDAPG